MTNDSGHSDGKGGGNQSPSRGGAASSDPAHRNNVLPIDRGRGVARRSWPMSASGISLNSGTGLLIVIGVLCGLLISESDRNPRLVSPKPEDPPKIQASTQNQPPAPAAKPPKPSPARTVTSVAPGDPAATPKRPPSYAPAKFQATHKKVFGGCTGELELTSTALLFRCPKSELDFPIDEIAQANKDGVVLKSGEKYHFAIANHSKDQAEAIFTTWLSRVQPTSQQSGTF